MCYFIKCKLETENAKRLGIFFTNISWGIMWKMFKDEVIFIKKKDKLKTFLKKI